MHTHIGYTYTCPHKCEEFLLQENICCNKRVFKTIKELSVFNAPV